MLTRRQLLASSAPAAAAAVAASALGAPARAADAPALPSKESPLSPAQALGYEPGFAPIQRAPAGKPLFEIGLAQWSLRDLHRGGGLANEDFGAYTRKTFGIGAIEYVSIFFPGRNPDLAHLRECKKRNDDAGVRTNLIMVDGEGALGDPDEGKRRKAVENHYKWVMASKMLGGHAIRVNAQSGGSYAEQMDRAADGLRQLTEFARGFGIGVCVENHGGLSSNADWMCGVMRKVGLPECGMLPDFGNCGRGGQETERYSTIDKFMPFAQSVSVKTWDIEEDGTHKSFDLERLMRIALAHGWHGVCAIESEGKPGGAKAVEWSQKALLAIREKLSKE